MREREIPEYNEAIMCPECGEHSDVLSGYGLVGGGIGPYTTCGRCGILVSKSQDPEAKVEPLPVIDTVSFEVNKDAQDDKDGSTK